MKLCQVVYQLNEDGILALMQLKWSNGVRSPFFAIENGNFVELSAQGDPEQQEFIPHNFSTMDLNPRKTISKVEIAFNKEWTGSGRNRQRSTTDNITGLAFKEADGTIIGEFISYAQTDDHASVVL